MTAINTAKGDKTLTYTTVEDTAANLATDAATNSGEGTFTQDKVVTVTDEASIAELTAINTAKGDKTLTYTTVEDTAANLATDAATNSGEGTFTKDKLVTVTTAAADVSVAQLMGFLRQPIKLSQLQFPVLQLILQPLKLRLQTKSLSPLLTKHLSLS